MQIYIDISTNLSTFSFLDDVVCNIHSIKTLCFVTWQMVHIPCAGGLLMSTNIDFPYAVII